MMIFNNYQYPRTLIATTNDDFYAAIAVTESMFMEIVFIYFFSTQNLVFIVNRFEKAREFCSLRRHHNRTVTNERKNSAKREEEREIKKKS
jgi:hypothetical protein